MTTLKKSTVYIDVDDEITAIIEKMLTAEHPITALVLPKRATVLHSLVNAKLLQKAASKVRKKVVLITSDSAVIAIASSAKMYVAATLSSKPEIPELTLPDNTSEEPLVEQSATTEEVNEAILPDENSSEDSLEIDNSINKSKVGLGALAGKLSKGKVSKIKIPDFSNFRLRFALFIGALVLLVIGWVFAFVVMPKAEVLVKADISNVPVDIVATLRLGGVEPDIPKKLLPAERSQVEKIDSTTVPATGEKNIGDKASGTMTLTNCIDDGEKKIIPAGTAFSSEGITFYTVEAVTLSQAYFSSEDTCASNDLPAFLGTYKDVEVVASQSGPESNLSARSYVSSMSGINAYGSAMSGGTTQIIKVVSAEDVEKARAELAGKSKLQAIEEVRAALLAKNVRIISETLTESEPQIVASPVVGAEAAETKVSVTINYSMLGVNDEHIKQMVETEIANNLKAQNKQDKNTRDNGMNSLSFIFVNKPNEADQSISIRTVATVGPNVDIEKLKGEIAGKKRGEIEKKIEAIDGVRSVTVNYSPGWITTTPKSAKKISITFDESND